MTTNGVTAAPARRRLILVLGRGRSGKTIWARWLTEVMRAKGVNPVVVDADTDDVGLGRHVGAVARLCADDDGEETAWWNAVLEPSEDRSPVVVDCSHNPGVIDRVHSEATGFPTRDLRDGYGAIGFNVTKVCFFAPDTGDADAFSTNGARVTTTDTLLVLNEGAPGQEGREQFDRVLAHPAVREAIDRGARVARMPALRSDLVADRHEISSFMEFSKFGGAGQEPSVFKRVTMRTWLERMETAFLPFGRELALR